MLPRIATKSLLKQYIIRQLGGEAVTVELTDDNLEDVIARTIEEYSVVAYSGVKERFIPVTLLPDVQDYTLPYETFAVLKVMSIDMRGIGNSVPSNMFSVNNFIAADLYKPGTAKIDLVGYELINEMIETMNLMFTKQISYDFNSITKDLHIFAPSTGENVMLHVYQKLDTTDASGSNEIHNIYNEKWIKDMSCARAQYQWAMNWLKYQGSTLPNGGQLNMEFIYNEAKDKIEKLSQDLEDRYSLPCDFFMG